LETFFVKARTLFFGLVILSAGGVGRAQAQSGYQYLGPPSPINPRYSTSYPFQPSFPMNSLTNTYFPAVGTSINPARAEYFKPKDLSLMNTRLGFQQNRAGRTRLGTMQEMRSKGMMTRTDQVRALSKTLMPEHRSRFGSSADVEGLMTPTKKMLQNRNLLSARSPLARRSLALMSRTDYQLDENGRMVGDSSRQDAEAKIAAARPTTSAPVSQQHFADQMGDLLNERKAKHFDAGVEQFRNKHYIEARNSFNIIKDIDSDAALPYMAVMVCSIHSQDFGQADGNFIRGLRRAKKLDDMRIDKTKFYADDRTFQLILDEINILAKRNPDAAGASLYLAYYSWLNGDTATAISSIDVAIKHIGDSKSIEYIQKFRTMLLSEKPAAPDKK
jgi:hypothetical protein